VVNNISHSDLVHPARHIQTPLLITPLAVMGRIARSVPASMTIILEILAHRKFGFQFIIIDYLD
jgi:hypothetical protein